MFCVQSPGDWMTERDDGNCGIMITKTPSPVGVTEETWGPADQRKALTMSMNPETSKP